MKRKQPHAGQPTKYRAQYARIAFRHCLLGATDADLAAAFQVSDVTINAWKQKHPKFLKAIKAGKADADGIVAESLFGRATGYSHADTDIRTVSIGEGISQIVQTPIIKHYPPDTPAAIFWLKNRQGKNWRNSDMELTVNANVSIGDQVAIELGKIKAKA